MTDKDQKTYSVMDGMDYREYRSQFESDEDFRKHYAQLPETVVHQLISRTNASTMIKACMFTTWKMIREEMTAKHNKEVKNNMPNEMITAVEEEFLEMSEKNCTRSAQIPVRRSRFRYLTEEYIPKISDPYVLFYHPGHFLIYDTASRQCLYDATYLSFEDRESSFEEDPIVGVIPKIVISQEDSCRVLLNDEFHLLCDLIDGGL